MTVLIVNDEIWTAQMIEEEVDWGSCGIDRVRTATSALGAREQIQAEQMDIVLCDIEMPGKSGIELMRWVREQGYGMECIFLTCHASFTYAQEAIRLGCHDYILMPASAQQIQEVLLRVVRKIRERREGDRLERYGAQWVESQKETAPGQGKRSSEDICRECEAFIQKNLSNPSLSVQLLARECHLNAVYLNRVFRKERGTTLGQYIIQERMDLAARLLRDSKVPSSVVAERTGYVNYSYFSTSFKKAFGCSPQSYAQGEKR